MWRKHALAVTLLALIPTAPAMAESANSRLQSATGVASRNASSDSTSSVAAKTVVAATTTETAGGTTTYFGKEPQPAREAAKPQPLPPPTLTASVDLTSQTMTVAVDGEAVYSWPISSGTAQYPTPTGAFYPEWTSKMWYSRKYDWAPMPNAVFINGGVAVHGTNHIGGLGSPASHGCIRLAPANAKTFYNLVQRHGLKMTRVTVYGRPHWRGDAIASRSETRKKTYAANEDNWFWGGPWAAVQDTAYTPGITNKNNKYNYTDAEGAPTKASRRKTSEYVNKNSSKRRKYSNADSNTNK